MSEKRTEITFKQMKAIARYELDFIQLMKDLGTRVANARLQGKYRFTLEDLYVALKNIVKKDPTIFDFHENWYFPLTRLEDAFGIDEAGGWDVDDEEDDLDVEGHELFSGLPLNEETLFAETWTALEDICDKYDGNEHVCDLEEIHSCLHKIELFFANKGKPVEEMEFTDGQKSNFITEFEDDSYLNEADVREIQLCRKFTEELCAKDSLCALHLKGYACYGGNRLYDCDWHASRDCVTRLYELTDDPVYANTLGYIYYYGRCTGGVPEYEKAFSMFSVSAANGLHEGMYKLADMYLHGYACKKSERTAGALYGMVYDDCYEQLVEGRDCAFADAALRMGNVYAKGIDVDKDYEAAYCYYLEAEFAAKKRAEHSSFFGDANVLLSIRNALDETRAQLPNDYIEKVIKIDRPWTYRGLVEKGYRAKTTIKRLKSGKTFVTVKRLPRRDQTVPQPVMITVPQLDYCELITEIKIEAVGLRTSFGDGQEISFKYDYCEWDNDKRILDFYFDEYFLGWIACDAYLFYNDKKTKPTGKLLKLVSVAFQPGGRTYDYLCDIEGVEVGNKVIVGGYDGETVVEVLKVYTRYESELVLPLSTYKKVIRKAPSR